MTRSLLLDNSAWARLSAPSVPRARRQQIATAIRAGQIYVCLPFLLEAGYLARTALAHQELVDELLALPRVRLTDDVEERALLAQRQLAKAGHHRLPPVDLLIAALADVHDLGVLHYDGDFDVIASRTELRFESVWLAQRGCL